MKKLSIDLDTPEWRGHWALVTGASSGIGREFCLQLAAKGLNLVLLARREQQLGKLADELRANHGTQTMIITLDLANPQTPAEIKRRLQEAGISIRLLVNNAAFGRWGRFEDQASALYQDLLQVDAIAPTHLCLELLPDLASHPSSAIIMLSSPAALQPVPYMAVYAAAKAYLHALAQALHAELAGRGILVQTLVPGPTATEFDQMAGAYQSALTARGTPEDVVRASLQGLVRGRAVVWQARGTMTQRMFALMPARWVLSKVAGMFAPPAERG